jgi:hypothetical protein
LGSPAAHTDIGLLEQMPPLGPFAPLSDSIRLLARYIEAVEAAIGGQADIGSMKFIQTLQELEGEVGAKMGPRALRLKRHALIAIGIINASLSRSIALDYADRLHAMALETLDPYAKSQSLRVRHHYHLRRGNWRQAQYWEHEVELDKLTDRSALFNPSGIFCLAEIYATVGSVAGMRECLTQIREVSGVSEGLRIWECYMEAEYDRLRGACEQALPRYRAILDKQAGRHVGWVYAAHGALMCLERLGRFQEGKRLGDELLERAEAAQLQAACGLILRPLALMEARLGDFAAAVAHLSENIEESKKLGMGGINLGIAYECRARVAVWADDREAFERYAELCAEQYHAGGGSPDLSARFEALLDEARGAGLVDANWRSRELGPMTLTHAQVELRDRLADCTSAESRCMQALLAIARAANATGGYLFGVTNGGLWLLASSGGEAAPETLLQSAAECISAAAERRASKQRESKPSARDNTTTGTDSESTGTDTGGTGGVWRGETCAGLLPQILSAPRDHAALGVFLLQRGPASPRAADRELMDVVAEALLAAGDVRASA